MRRTFHAFSAAALSIIVTGCGPDAAPPDPFTFAPGCNPIAFEGDCLLPFPSDHFRVDDTTLPSGKRIRLSPESLAFIGPAGSNDMQALHPVDGYSLGSQILALFPGGVDDSPLTGATGDFSRTTTKESPTLLLEANTGKLIPHFAELDPRATEDDRRALLIRPLVRLEEKTRYVVVLHSLRDKTGAPLAPSEGFRRLRDGEGSKTPALADVTKHYDTDIFPIIEAAGINRSMLNLAWDFTTVTEDVIVRDMLDVRQDVLQHLSMAAPKVTIAKVTDNVDTYIQRRIDGTIKVPAYLESEQPNARLRRNAQGKVEPQGEFDVPFSVWIPRSVANWKAGDPPVRLMQYGHGFFGSREEAAGDFVNVFADELKMVVFAADWWGMAKEDRTPIGDTIVTNPALTAQFTDRVHQAMGNFISVEEWAATNLAQIPEMQMMPPEALAFSTPYFYGNSLGGILGTTYMSLVPRIERGALSVCGADFSLMMFRSRAFLVFLLVIAGVLPDPLDQQKFAALLQSSLDRIDPLTYAPHVLKSPFPGTPANRFIAMQIGMGDPAIPNIASHLSARTLGLLHLQPAPRPIWNMETAMSPVAGSALTEFDFGINPLPGDIAIPPAQDNPVHESVRRLGASKAQLDQFFQPNGTIVNTCNGACDPE